MSVIGKAALHVCLAREENRHSKRERRIARVDDSTLYGEHDQM